VNNSNNLQSIQKKAEKLVAQLEKSNAAVLQSLTISIISISNFKFSHTQFSPEEINYYKNKIPSLAGRYAAKLSIRKALNKNIPFKDISILSSQSGEPLLSLAKNTETSHNLSFSITHEDELAAGLLAVSKAKYELVIGLDATRNNRIATVAKQLPVLQKILTKKELDEAYTNEQLAKIWTAKEAVSKALGIGIWHGGVLQKIEILIQDDKTKVKLHEEMLEIAKNKGISKWNISFISDEKFTLALVLGFPQE
jgi:holo-[acyl-carrier-protein] synthase